MGLNKTSDRSRMISQNKVISVCTDTCCVVVLYKTYKEMWRNSRSRIVTILQCMLPKLHRYVLINEKKHPQVYLIYRHNIICCRKNFVHRNSMHNMGKFLHYLS